MGWKPRYQVHMSWQYDILVSLTEADNEVRFCLGDVDDGKEQHSSETGQLSDAGFTSPKCISYAEVAWR
jgi:hypothetical protein